VLHFSSLGMCSCLPDVWENSDDVHNPAVSFVMSVNQFEEILHVTSTSLRIRTFWLESSWQRLSNCTACWTSNFCDFGHLSRIWMSTSPWLPVTGNTRRNSSLEINRSASVSNCWCLNTRLGYLVQCEPYQGGTAQIDSDLDLCGSQVVDLRSKLPKRNYFVYIDNYFTLLSCCRNWRHGMYRDNKCQSCGERTTEACRQGGKEDWGLPYRHEHWSDRVQIEWQQHGDSCLELPQSEPNHLCWMLVSC